VPKRSLPFVLLLGAFTAAAVAVALRGAGAFEAGALLAALEEARRTPWLGPAYAALFGATTFLAPAFGFFVIAGALWGFWPGWLAGWLAASLWSNLHFAAGRWLLRGPVTAWLAAPRLALLRRELEQGGALAVVLVRQLPLPFVGVNAAAGASPMTWRRFALGNAAGLLPSSVIYAWSASAILEGVEGARAGAVARVLLAAGAILALGVSSRLLQRWAQRHPAP
jgi:uncharacterized membrane protein YdjX (TVP38/TMEM64 family)